MNYNETIEKLNEQSLELIKNNKIEEAERISKNALHLAEQYSITDSSAYLDSLCIMGEIYTVRELYKDAAVFFSKALNLLGRNTKKITEYAATMHKYAFILMKNGNLKESIRQYKNVCKYFETRKINDIYSYSITLFNLSYAYNESGKKFKAERTMLKALRVRKKLMNEKPLLYAEALHTYASFCEGNKWYAKAHYFYKEATKIRISENNGFSEDYLLSLTGVAYTAEALGYHEDAKLLYKKIVSIREELNGKQSVEYAIALTNLAFAYDMVKDNSKARELYHKALDIFQSLNITDTADYATVLHNLGCNYQQKEEHARAIEIFRKVLPLRKRLLGEQNPDYIFTKQCLSYSLAAIGDVDEAQEILDSIPNKANNMRIINLFIIIVLLLILFFVGKHKGFW